MPSIENKLPLNDAAEFLSRSFTSGETIALLLRRVSSRSHRAANCHAGAALRPRYLGWLASENATGAKSTWRRIHCVAGSKKRTKESVAEIRHLYLDLDVDGESKLATLRSSTSVPTPTAIVSTSSVKYQVLWRVEDFTLEQQESTAQAVGDRLRWRSCVH